MTPRHLALLVLGMSNAALVQGVPPPTTPAPSASTATVTEPGEPELPFSADEGEAKEGASLTPISSYQTKKPYDQAREILQKAQEAWKAGRTETASNLALEAYDDLLEAHFPRKMTKARKKLRAERHQAAEVYVGSSLDFIRRSAERQKMTEAAKTEARARMNDLRDVAREYPELNAKVDAALADLR